MTDSNTESNDHTNQDKGTDTPDADTTISGETAQATPRELKETHSIELPEGVTDEPQNDLQIPLSKGQDICGDFNHVIAVNDISIEVFNNNKLSDELKALAFETSDDTESDTKQKLSAISNRLKGCTNLLMSDEGVMEGVLTCLHLLIGTTLLNMKPLGQTNRNLVCAQPLFKNS